MQDTAIKCIETFGANMFEKYTKTRVGCRGIVVENDKMLISHELNSEFYLIPGGGIEDGETLEECCVREVLEETGYKVAPLRHFLTINEYYEEYKYVSHYFVCKVVGRGEVRLTDAETERGLVPEWVDVGTLLSIYEKHNDYDGINEEKRGSYLREYKALTEYLAQFGGAL